MNVVSDDYLLHLPVGISFYTFQTMAYTIDLYRGDLQKPKWTLEVRPYVSFPTTGGGSCGKSTALLPQFSRPFAVVFR